MDLTIVIVSFKSGEILHRCLESIHKDLQIIVIENSIDNNFKIGVETKYKNVKCIYLSKTWVMVQVIILVLI